MTDPLTVEALVDIRLSLSEAIRQSGSPMPNDRVRAVVALDAAVERTAFFAANRRGVTVTSRTTLGDLIGALAGDLGRSWSFDQRQEITRLHSARNKAQHEGLYPAQEHMTSFRTATETFVRTLTVAVTGLDASTVVLAAAVRDAEVREVLEAASGLATADASPLETVHRCREAYDLVHQKWTAQRRAARLDQAQSFNYDAGFREFRDIANHAKQIERQLRDSADAALFSVDPGEQVWFKQLSSDARKGDVHVSPDEASRALSFVFGWTLRWQQVAGLVELDREHLAMVMRRRTRSAADRSPRIASADVRGRGSDAAVLKLSLEDVPENDQFDEWSDGLQELLTAQRQRHFGSTQHWVVRADGMVEVTIYPHRVSDSPGPTVSTYDPLAVPEPPPVPEQIIAAVVGDLRLALGQVETEIESRQAAERERMTQEGRADQAFARSTEGRLPAWVDRIEIDHSGRNLHGMDRSENVPYFVWFSHELPGQQVAAIIRRGAGVRQFYSTTRDAFSYIPDGVDPIEPLEAATGTLLEALRDRRRQLQPHDDWAARAQRAADVAVEGED